MAVTLKDIAERTGVSPSVVSTVLSGRDNGTFVSETTRRKVLQVAEMLNYTPVRSGRPRGSRRLRRQREEHFIGIWDPSFGPATSNYIRHVQTALSQHAVETGAESEDDYGLRILTTEDLPRLDSIGVMGIILLGSTVLPRSAASATIPCVMIGEVDNPPRELVQVHVDNFAAGREIAEYLWGLGHRIIAFLAPGTHPRVTRQRYHGIKSVWIKRQADPNLIFPIQYDSKPAPSERDQIRREIMERFNPSATRHNRPTALVCDDEHVAALVAQTLTEAGCSVPGDVSLTGFDDTPQIAEFMIPPLTTVRLPIEHLAKSAIEQLYKLHDEIMPISPEARDFSFTGQLIVRASCAERRTG
ncbi:MAG: LacI family DNA-binding transcriptional regulator [Capsulimonadaceae bacterium]